MVFKFVAFTVWSVVTYFDGVLFPPWNFLTWDIHAIRVQMKASRSLSVCIQCWGSVASAVWILFILYSTIVYSKQPLHPDFKTVNLFIAAATSTPFQILNLSQFVIIVASIKVQDTCNVVGHIYRLCFTCIILVKRQAFHDKFDSRLLSCGRGEREIGDRHSCLCLTSSI